MNKTLGIGFWEYIARIILRNRMIFLSGIILITVLLVFQWKNIKFTQTEANLIPADDQINVDYNKFLKNFGEEGNLIVIATKDPKLFTPKVYNAWRILMENIQSDKAVDLVISINNLKKLYKNDSLEKFDLIPLINPKKSLNQAYLTKTKNELLNNYLFMKGYFLIKNRAPFVLLFIWIKKL